MGLVKFDDGSAWPVEMKGDQWQGEASLWLNWCDLLRQSECVNPAQRPTELVLYSAASKDGEGQSFPIALSESTVVDRVELSPQTLSTFDILTVKAYGRGMKQNVAVNVPNCRNLVEKRSEGNTRWDNWATDFREFTCETTLAGTDLVATVEGMPAVFSITTINCELGRTAWRGACVAVGEIQSNPAPATVGAAVQVWFLSQWANIRSVVFSFAEGVVELVASISNGVSDKVSYVFERVGTFIVGVALRDESGQPITGLSEFWIDVVGRSSASIASVISDSLAQPGAIANNGSTDDTTPALSGTVSPTLTLGQKVNVYDGDVLFDAVAVVSGTTWSFTPAAPLSNGTHSFTVEVAGVDGTPGPRSAPYVITIDSSSVSSVFPGEIVRTLTGKFDIVGRDLPTSGLSVTVPGDPKASCQSPEPNSMTAAGFGVECTFYQLGVQTLEVRTATKLIGTVQVTVKSNVTGVTWTSPSTTNSGTVKFGETVTFKVAGVNLLADPVMGFAVQLCGVSNAEAGAGSDTQRTFTCNFNNAAGAVAGQMPGVVKDAPGGQVLFDGWNVPVEVPAAAGTIDLPATSFVRGEGVALSANGYGPDTLMAAPPYVSAPNAAEWDFTVPTAGTYELFAEYAAAQSRPVVISFNGVVKFNNSLSMVTGDWFPANRQVVSQGTVQLAAGATTMRVSRSDAFPHIKGFKLVKSSIPVSAIINPANGHGYEVVECGNWIQCRDVAIAKGGSLVTIRSQSENSWIVTNLLPSAKPNAGLWIGLTDAAREGTWVWQSGESPGYLNWRASTNEPNNGVGSPLGEEDYGVIPNAAGWDGAWNDQPLVGVTQAIVEYSQSSTSNDVSADFSALQNPNGAYSYGWKRDLSSPFVLLTSKVPNTRPGFSELFLAWAEPGSTFESLMVFKNPSSSAVTWSTLTLPANALAMHPGPVAQKAVTRWTAPMAGSYEITAEFVAADSVTVDVHIQHNGASIFSDNLIYSSKTRTQFSKAVSFLAGDTIDFVVGDGGNGFHFDSTVVRASIKLKN